MKFIQIVVHSVEAKIHVSTLVCFQKNKHKYFKLDIKCKSIEIEI